MDIQTQDFDTDGVSTGEPEPGLSPIFTNRLLRKLAATLPLSPEEHPEEFAEEWEAARELFWALHPRNPVEAALAARAVAFHNRGMDMCARAAKPGVSDEKALRLSANALAAARSFDAALRTLGRWQKPAQNAVRAETGKSAPQRPSAGPRHARSSAAAEQPEPAPMPHVELFQPRDRYGKPIPDWRYEWMTAAQRRATYCYPRNPDLEAAAIAEEEAMIAAQQAEDAAAALPSSCPSPDQSPTHPVPR